MRSPIVRASLALCALLLGAASSLHAQELAVGDAITHAGVSVATLDGVRVQRTRRGWRQVRGDLEWSVRLGRTLRATGVTTTTTARICDVDAVRRETHTRARARENLRGAQYPMGHFCCVPARPAMTTVTLTIPRGSESITLEWRLRTERREALRSIEDALFASMQCAPPEPTTDDAR